jgi:hypothetical protein
MRRIVGVDESRAPIQGKTGYGPIRFGVGAGRLLITTDMKGR